MLARPEFFFIWSLIKIFQKIDFFGQIKTEGLWCHQHANGNPLQRSNMIFSSCSPSSREAPHLPSCHPGHPQVLLPPIPQVWLLPQMKDWTGLQPRDIKRCQRTIETGLLSRACGHETTRKFHLDHAAFHHCVSPKSITGYQKWCWRGLNYSLYDPLLKSFKKLIFLAKSRLRGFGVINMQMGTPYNAATWYFLVAPLVQERLRIFLLAILGIRRCCFHRFRRFGCFLKWKIGQDYSHEISKVPKNNWNRLT